MRQAMLGHLQQGGAPSPFDRIQAGWLAARCVAVRIVEARPVGLYRMKDKGEPDDKILAVLEHDPVFADTSEYINLQYHYVK